MNGFGMNGFGMFAFIFCYTIIPWVVIGSALIFVALWSRGWVIGKQMSLIVITLLVSSMISISIYRYLGILDFFVLFDEYMYYLSWAACAALIFAFVLTYTLPAKAYIFTHIATILLFALFLNYLVNPSIDYIKGVFEHNRNENNLSQVNSQETAAIAHQFEDKTQKEKYSLYTQAIYDNNLSKEVYQYFIQQFGNPLKDEQGSLDYKSLSEYDYYTIPFFTAIHEKNLTALQVFIDYLKGTSPEELKHSQACAYGVPTNFFRLENNFATLYDPMNKNLNNEPDEAKINLKIAELILPIFPKLAITKDGSPIVDITIQNADLNAMKLFSKYSTPSSKTLATASYVLSGDVEKLVDTLNSQPSLLNQKMTIGNYYSESTTLQFYIFLFGKKEIIQAISPMIKWKSEDLYYNEGYSFALAYAARRLKAVLRGESEETNQDAIDIFSFLINTTTQNKMKISNDQLWDITIDELYIDNGKDKRNVFNDEAIKAICTSDIGPQYLEYVSKLDRVNTNDRIKLTIDEVIKVCH